MKRNFAFKNIICLLYLVCFIFVTPPTAIASNDQALFAGGCFWCLEHDFEELDGVISVESGYSGGNLDNPTYRNHQGHQEVIQVNYDPRKITFRKLLRSYWRNIDPFDSNGQFCDKGESYKPVIFFKDNDQLEDSNSSLVQAAQELEVSLEDIQVKIMPVKKFWIAEDYHQDYAKNNTLKYNFYRSSCGRNKRLNEVWGSNSRSNAEWRTPLKY